MEIVLSWVQFLRHRADWNLCRWCAPKKVGIGQQPSNTVVMELVIVTDGVDGGCNFFSSVSDYPFHMILLYIYAQ